jgi:hypothetical protein
LAAILKPYGMRKNVLLNTILLILFFHGKSQINSLEYGFHGGINLNSASGTAVNQEYKNTLLGFNIGGHFKINTSNRFGIKAILQYDQNGWAYRSLTFEDNTGTIIGMGDVLFKLNYLNLPILAEYSFGNKITFNTAAGLFLGILLNNQIITKVNEPIAPNPVTTTKTSSDFRKSGNFGISLSAGIQIPISAKTKLVFNIHDNYGLSNIYEAQGSSGNTLKTNSFALISGFTFLL